MRRSLLVPGIGCGIVKSVKMLGSEGADSNVEVSSASEAECGVVQSQEALEAVIKQVEVLKCVQGQMDCADMKCKPSPIVV